MYNAQETIIRAIESIRNQSYRTNYEVIVINDGSRDNSQEIVEEYLKKLEVDNSFIVKLINQLNGGVSKARNTGLSLSSGELIAFLDSDDAWILNKIEVQMKCLNKNSEIDFLGGGFEGFIFKGISNNLINVKLKMLIFKNYFQPSTVIMKRKVFDSIGYFDENQKYAEEGNYFFRVSNLFNCYFLNEKLIIYGDGKSGFGVSGLSANLREMERGELKNLKFAFKNGWINILEYISSVIYSVLKYFRRILIVKVKNI